MNSRQRNKQYMLRNLLHFLDENKSKWENEALISTQIDEIYRLKAELDKAISLEEQLSMPFSGIRNDEREDFNRVFSQLSGILHSMYLTAGRKDKAYLIGLSPRELMRDSLEKVAAKSSNISAASEDFKAELEAEASFKVVYDSAMEWNARFQENMILPAVRRKKRKQTLENIDELQNEILAFLKAHLDMNMRIFNTTEPNFHNAYLNFRKVQSSKSSGESTVDQGGGETPPIDEGEGLVNASGESTGLSSSEGDSEGSEAA